MRWRQKSIRAARTRIKALEFSFEAQHRQQCKPRSEFRFDTARQGSSPVQQTKQPQERPKQLASGAARSGGKNVNQEESKVEKLLIGISVEMSAEWAAAEISSSGGTAQRCRRNSPITSSSTAPAQLCAFWGSPDSACAGSQQKTVPARCTERSQLPNESQHQSF